MNTSFKTLIEGTTTYTIIKNKGIRQSIFKELSETKNDHLRVYFDPHPGLSLNKT